MIRLDDMADDAYLDEGQRKEETLGSVDYDVWHCPNCGTQTVEAYNAWFSFYQKCAQCSHRTMSVNRMTLTIPTYTATSTGSETQ